MKHPFFLTTLLLLAVSCEKEQDVTGPVQPPREEVTLENATAVLALPEQAGGRVLLYDVPSQTIVWEWTPADSGLTGSDASLFRLPDEAKPVYGKTALLITASGGGCALVRIRDKELLFLARPGGNPHSAEILPDGNIVVASSNGTLKVYRFDPEHPRTEELLYTTTVTSAHNVVWDRARDCLWTASMSQVICYRYPLEDGTPGLERISINAVSTGSSTAHDLSPVYGEDALYVTFNDAVHRYDCTRKRFSSVQVYNASSVKSISSGPAGYPTVLMRPNSASWWSTEIRDISGNLLLSEPSFQIYKARWFIDNPFSYPEGQTL